jgi:hypothetical protein
MHSETSNTNTGKAGHGISQFSSSLKNRDIKSSIRQKSPATVSIKATAFADKMRHIDSQEREKVISAIKTSSSDAKSRLLDMRKGSSEGNTLTREEFNSILENKPFAISYNVSSGEKLYIFAPHLLKEGLDPFAIPTGTGKHDITDNPYYSPPVSENVANLQQRLKIGIDGLFGFETFNAFVSKYMEALFAGRTKTLDLFDPLLRIFVSKLAGNSNYGAYLRNILTIKEMIYDIEAGRPTEIDLLSLHTMKYLPDSEKYLLRERIKIVQKISECLKGDDSSRAEKINRLLREDLKNLTIEDKLKILEVYGKLLRAARPNEPDFENQLVIIKSIGNAQLNKKQKERIFINLNYVEAYYKDRLNQVKLMEAKTCREKLLN